VGKGSGTVFLEVSEFAVNATQNIAAKRQSVSIEHRARREKGQEHPRIDCRCATAHISIRPTYIRRKILFVHNFVRCTVSGWRRRTIRGTVRHSCFFFALLLATLEFPAQNRSMRRGNTNIDSVEYVLLGDHLPRNGVLMGACRFGSHGVHGGTVKETM
jgi:hypothetical protein